MKSAVENLEPTRAKLTVEVPFEELKPALDKAYRDIAQQVQVPGFRRGKVPARIIDQRFGRGAVIEQAVNAELNGFYQQAVAEQSVTVLGRPTVDVTEIPSTTGTLEGQLVFTAEVDVRPEITIPDLAGVELTVENAEVTDEDVEQRLTELRARFGSLKGVDRAIEEGDFVVIDLTAEIDGEEIDSVSGVSYEVGSASMLPGMDEALVGKKAEETVQFTAPLAGGPHAGEDANVTVTPTAVKERELPEADDEFAEMASEFDTIDELRADLRTQEEKSKAENQAIAARDKLLEHLRETVEFPLPQGVIDDEIASHLEQEGKPADDPHGEEIREDVTSMLRDQLLLDVLSEKFEVDVSQEDLFNFLVTSAQQYGMDPNQFIQAAAQTGQLPAFSGEIARNKALAVALRDIEVKDEAGNVLDLSEYIGSEELDREASGEGDAEGEAAEEKPAAKKAPAKDDPEAAKNADKKSDEAKAEKEADDSAENPYADLKATELRAELESRSLPVSGTKAVMVERLLEDDAAKKDA